jgi:DNA-binding SARP family transcriptional activator
VAVQQLNRTSVLNHQPNPSRAGALGLALLKGFELTDDGERIAVPLSSQRLMAFLALNQRPLPRVYIAGTLWTDSSDEHSSGSLRSALWRLQRPGYRLLEVHGDHICLARQVQVDVRTVEMVARRLMDGREGVTTDDVHTLASGGELLPGWYDDWILVERERLRQLRLHALETMCTRLVQQQRLSEAILAGLAAVEGEPLRESAHRTLINAYLAEGNCAEAVRQFRSYQRLIHEELALAPSSEFFAVMQGLLH